MVDKNFCGFINSRDGLYQMVFNNGYSIAMYTGESFNSGACDIAVYKNGINITEVFFPDDDIEDFRPDCEFYDVMQIIIAVSAISNEDIRDCMLNDFDSEDVLSICTDIDKVVAENE